MTTTQRFASPGSRVRRGLAAMALALGLLVGIPAAASAIPPDGPGPETPGTKSKVWPRKVKAGERLNFEVWGYPANETVYIKIDDGNMCSDTSHGACVYHTQKLDKKGHAKGSLIVPDLAPGKHWLRMLATGDVFDSKTGEKIGYQGYTRRGGNDFTVVAGGSSSKNAGGTAEGGGAVNSDGTIAGGSVEIDLAAEGAGPEAEPEETTATQETSSSPAAAEPAASPSSAAGPAPAVPEAGQAPAAVPQTVNPGGGPPVVGIAALAGALVVGGGAIGWAMLRRNRLLKQAAAAAGGE